MTPYNLREDAIGSLATTLGSKIQKGAKAIGKREGQKAKEEAIAKADAAAKRSAAAKKGAKTKKEKATPKIGHTSASSGIDVRPALPPIKPVVLTRQQHFESAVGNSKDTPTRPISKPADEIITMGGAKPADLLND